MKTIKWIGVAACTIAFAIATSGPALTLKLKDIARVVAPTITIPFEAGQAIIQGDDPSKVFTDTSKSYGTAIQQGTQVIQQTYSQALNIPRNVIDQNLGGDWTKAYDILTARERVRAELLGTKSPFGNVING